MARISEFEFQWHCICGASWKGRFARTPADPEIQTILDTLRRRWEKAHSGNGHHPTESGRAAAWARRKTVTGRTP